MFKSIIDFYRVSQAKPCNGGALSSNSLSGNFRPEDIVFILAFVRPNECMNCLILRKQLRQPLDPFRGPGLYMLDIVAISTYIFRVDQVDRLAPAHVV